MFKINRKILLIIFAIVLFVLGTELSLIFENGFDNPIFDFSLLISLIISAVYFYLKIFRGEVLKKKEITQK